MAERSNTRRVLLRYFVQPEAMRILDFLAPPTCAFCGLPTAPPETGICGACFADLPWNEAPVSTSPGIFDACIAMLNYSFPVDVAIKALKFSRKLYYAPAFVEVLLTAEALLPPDIDALLPVPLHWRRKTRRGFNQATELAKPVAKVHGLPIVRSVIRQKFTPFQSGLPADERAKNLRAAFTAARAQQYRHVLIIDDVVTTGATVAELAKIILAAGALKVSVLAVARV